MEVNRSVPAATVSEFIGYAKANPGKINMGSSGAGTAPHLAGEMFKTMTGVNMVHVPYRGEPPAIADMLGGQVQVMFGNVTASIAHIRSGALRALAVTSDTRSSVLPGTPTVADTELLPGQFVLVRFARGPKGMLAIEVRPEATLPGLAMH